MLMIDSGTKSDIRVWLADLTHTGINSQSIGVDTFPLAIGCVAAYAESKIIFTDPIRLFRYPEKLAGDLAREERPDIIGFSNFIWNSELSLATARSIKELYPRTVVVMGGPNYPLERVKQEAFLRAHPEIDFYIVHEGESAFVNLVSSLNAYNMDADKIKQNLGLGSVQAIDRRGNFVSSGQLAQRLENLDEIPSPYITGKLDEFFDGRLWPLIQTKRGCPFTCTYCTEGNGYYNRIAKFGIEHLRAEIEYIGKKISVVRAKGGRSDLYIGDSNFGMYEEDLEVAKALAFSFKRYGWPDHINTSTGKNQKQRILETARLVGGRIVLSGSVQSLDPVVLENIKRKNIAVDQLISLAKAAGETDANSYCEVILALPGETKKSHLQTLRTVVTAGFNKVISYQLMILSGSELATEEVITRYGMELRSRVLPRAFGIYNIESRGIKVADIEDVCVATNSMSYQDYVECRIMHLVITVFYNDLVFGTLLKAIRANGLSVYRWLELILELIPATDLKGLFEDFRRHTETELWKSRKDLEVFIQEPDTIERYVTGEIGFNLLYTFKAMVLTHYVESMVNIVRVAAGCLRGENQRLGAETNNFFDAAIRWDAARMVNIIKKLDDDVIEVFQYDILRFAADDNPKEAGHYYCASPVSWRFNLSKAQKDYMRRNLSIFGDDVTGIGRILSNSHTKQLLRQAVLIDKEAV